MCRTLGGSRVRRAAARKTLANRQPHRALCSLSSCCNTSVMPKADTLLQSFFSLQRINNSFQCFYSHSHSTTSLELKPFNFQLEALNTPLSSSTSCAHNFSRGKSVSSSTDSFINIEIFLLLLKQTLDCEVSLLRIEIQILPFQKYFCIHFERVTF